jgi:hypothetical protein
VSVAGIPALAHFRPPRKLRKIAAALARQGKRLSIWFQDEARIGQKGRVCHVCF